MIDHMGITISDIEKSKAFYSRALGALGYVLCKNGPRAVSFGVREGHGRSSDPGGDFWLSKGPLMTPRAHFAFNAASRADVDAFFAAAVVAGGVENGAPGLRAYYHPHYYAASCSIPMVTISRRSAMRDDSTARLSATRNRPPMTNRNKIGADIVP